MRLGYLIGQFPGPSHTYFWREISALRAANIEVDIISTRRPQTALATHDWTQTALSQTKYLFPLALTDLASALHGTLIAHPRNLLRCLSSWLRSDSVSLSERAKLAAYIFLGGRLARLAHQRHWQHLRVGFCGEQANIALYSHLLGGPPYSLTLHSPLKSFGPNQKQKWQHAVFGFAVAQSLLTELQQKVGTLPPHMRVLPMGVDAATFTRSASYTPWQPGTPARLFCGARLTPRKGQLDLIRAVAQLRSQGLDVHLRLAGEDMGETKWFTGQIQSLLAQLDLEPHVDLLGIIPEDQIRRELEHAHLLVLASYEEGMSVAVMEAMAMELPVIVTNVDGMPELVHHNTHGLVLPPGNPDLLAQSIHQLLHNPQLALTMGQLGRQRVLQHFSCQRVIRETLELLQPTPTPSTPQPFEIPVGG